PAAGTGWCDAGRKGAAEGLALPKRGGRDFGERTHVGGGFYGDSLARSPRPPEGIARPVGPTGRGRRGLGPVGAGRPLGRGGAGGDRPDPPQQGWKRLLGVEGWRVSGVDRPDPPQQGWKPPCDRLILGEPRVVDRPASGRRLTSSPAV